MLELGKYSFGMGDRFAHQAAAQLQSCILAARQGVHIIPVWNKSNREHTTIGSEPASVRTAAEAAIREADWSAPFHIDADHINLATVDRFLEPSDFFTIDVASFIGRPPEENAIDSFLQRHGELAGTIQVPGLAATFELTRDDLRKIAAKYLLAVSEASKIYRYIVARKGEGKFITEISMDETDAPQTPPELLVILAAIADAAIPIQTIAPKFTGRFNKGVDYVGDLRQFEQEFNDDLAVIACAIDRYGLRRNLKLSVHSGSDKFSIYGPIRRALRRTGAGLHVKTAGTTWLEEVIGLAESGGDGLGLAQEIYAEALEHLDELCAPYASVIDIASGRLPRPEVVNSWTAEEFTNALRHEPTNPSFNPHLRQLLHVGYKVAAKKGGSYLSALEANKAVIARNVTENLFGRHIRPLFLES